MSSNELQTASNGADGFVHLLNNGRLSKGQIAKWDAEAKWHDRDGLALPTPMFIIGYDTGLRRWKDKQLEEIVNKPLPNVAALNTTVPVAEWELDLAGKPRPPWAKNYAVYMVDLIAGTLYSYVHDTVGARICFDQLRESIAVMQALRGARVLPVAQLDQRPMKTNFGMKSRPHLQIIGWRIPGGGGGDSAALAPAPAPPLTGPAPAPQPVPAQPIPPAAAATLAATEPVKPVSAGEFINDEIPFSQGVAN
jgi:hypothetical protein